jgi:hypothetical protein
MPYLPKNFGEVKVKGWKSEHISAENLLRHLQREAMGYGAPGYSSIEPYVAILAQFCRFSWKNPDHLVALLKGKIEELVHSYLDQSLAKGLSRKTVKTRRSFLLRFKKYGSKGALRSTSRSTPSPQGSAGSWSTSPARKRYSGWPTPPSCP